MTVRDVLDVFESENVYIVALFTGASYVTAAVVMCIVLRAAVIDGAWLGAFVPFFTQLPFLLYARVIAPENRGFLRHCVAFHHVLAWCAVALWLWVLDHTVVTYPQTDTDRRILFQFAALYSLAALASTRGGALVVLWHWRACRANARAIRRAVIGHTPLSEICETCIRDKRAPTPAEHARVIRALVTTIEDGRHPIHPKAHALIAIRHRAYAKRLAKEMQYLRSGLECITLAIEYADREALRQAVDGRIAKMTVRVSGKGEHP